MYKALVLIFVIVAVVLVAYKEYGERDKTDPNYIFKKMSQKLFEMKKVPEKDIYLTTEFRRHLSMHDSEVDTLGFQMQKELSVDFYINNFRKSKTVGEAVDFLRVIAEEKENQEKKELQKKSLKQIPRVLRKEKNLSQ